MWTILDIDHHHKITIVPINGHVWLCLGDTRVARGGCGGQVDIFVALVWKILGKSLSFGEENPSPSIIFRITPKVGKRKEIVCRSETMWTFRGIDDRENEGEVIVGCYEIAGEKVLKSFSLLL